MAISQAEGPEEHSMLVRTAIHAGVAKHNKLGRVDGFDKGFDQYYSTREADKRAEGDVGLLAT
jgi:hypothetical protein